MSFVSLDISAGDDYRQFLVALEAPPAPEASPEQGLPVAFRRELRNKE
jgi:hypothetical protein